MVMVALIVLAGCSGAAPQVRRASPTTTIPAVRRGQITDLLVVSTAQVVTGRNLVATLVIDNSGDAIDLTKLATARVNEAPGKLIPEHTGCKPNFVVNLIGEGAKQQISVTADCEGAPFVIRHGTTRLPFQMTTLYSACLQGGGQTTPALPDCQNGSVPPLPVGTYETQVAWSETVPVPSPKPLKVSIVTAS